MKALRFAGYAAVFDHADRGGDVVRRGAFSRAVQAGPERVLLLWQHRTAEPIGRIERIAEDERGLRVVARLSPRSTEAAALLRAGALGGLSFGYRVRSSAQRHHRELTDLDLIEISLVTSPMQPLARVHALDERDA